MGDVVVLAGGDPPPVSCADAWHDALRLAPAHRVIAADGGLRLAARLGLRVDLLIGDLDSVTAAEVEQARGAGVRVERHPAAKDATDLALALDAALASDPERITVIGGGGGRADHELAIWLLLASPAYADVPLRWWSPRGVTHVVHPARPCALEGAAGELCSLLPVHGGATGVRTSGLRYPLTDEPLPPGTSRGVSNELAATHATVTIDDGVLLVVLPVPPDLTSAAGSPADRPAPPPVEDP